MDQQVIIFSKVTGMHAGDKSMHYEAMNRWNDDDVTKIRYEEGRRKG